MLICGEQAKRIERKEQGVTPAEAANEPVRSSLAVLSVQNKSRPAEQSNVPGAFAFARQKRKATAAADKENGGGLDIYVDDAFKPGKAALSLPPAAPTGLWTKLGSHEQNRQVSCPLRNPSAVICPYSSCFGRHGKSPYYIFSLMRYYCTQNAIICSINIVLTSECSDNKCPYEQTTLNIGVLLTACLGHASGRRMCRKHLSGRVRSCLRKAV